MWQNLFQHIDIAPANVHILDGNAENLQEECDSFERKIKEAGGVDLFVGGKKDNIVISDHIIYDVQRAFIYTRMVRLFFFDMIIVVDYTLYTMRLNKHCMQLYTQYGYCTLYC